MGRPEHVGDGGQRTAIGRRHRTPVEVEAHRRREHVVRCHVHRRVHTVEAVGEPSVCLRGDQDRTDAVCRVEQTADHGDAFDDEELVPLPAPAGGRIDQLEVVDEAGIPRIVDRDGLVHGAAVSRPEGLPIGDHPGRLEQVYLQGSLLGLADPEVDPTFAGIRRIALDDACWVDHLPGWLRGDEAVFDQLYHGQSWHHRTVTMYARRLPEPRLTSWWTPADGPEPVPVLAEIRTLLSSRYGEEFSSIGFNCYRDGADSVAWHGDRHRHTIDNPIVATVSLGAPRPFRLRPRRGRPAERAPASRTAMGLGGAAPVQAPPRGGGHSQSFDLGRGDLLVMGGACQHDWEHTVPKVRVVSGPRISITYRHGTR